MLLPFLILINRWLFLAWLVCLLSWQGFNTFYLCFSSRDISHRTKWDQSVCEKMTQIPVSDPLWVDWVRKCAVAIKPHVAHQIMYQTKQRCNCCESEEGPTWIPLTMKCQVMILPRCCKILLEKLKNQRQQGLCVLWLELNSFNEFAEEESYFDKEDDDEDAMHTTNYRKRPSSEGLGAFPLVDYDDEDLPSPSSNGTARYSSSLSSCQKNINRPNRVTA